MRLHSKRRAHIEPTLSFCRGIALSRYSGRMTELDGVHDFLSNMSDFNFSGTESLWIYK